jgi:eukaryotic-like serine/threonine-protein kinase
VMEHLDGGSLSQRIREGPAGWAAAHLEPFAQVCDALHFAHTQGIVHHDPKPANVILLAGGRAVLHDWGLARRVTDTRPTPPPGVPVSEETDPDDGADGFIAGTPAYMSPEQARGDTARLTPASDIFCVGAGLFEAITGRRWAYEEGAREIMARVVLGQMLPLREVRPDVPDELNRIVTRAMAFRPEDRHPSAAALASDLRAFLAGQRAGE